VSAPEIDPAQFRQLLGRFATGVTILTVVTPDGRPIGMTANSLSSVSLRPPLISVCVDREADMHGAILKTGEFVVNVLSSPQETLARRFSDEHDDRFDGVGYHLSPDGLILLDGAWPTSNATVMRTTQPVITRSSWGKWLAERRATAAPFFSIAAATPH
jgi:flavin reductase (DIM6/NTAB) family NADH-FMN oxidoreductase RutF